MKADWMVDGRQRAARPAGPTRILYVVDQIVSATAGTERQFIELVEGLDRTRFDPHVAVLRPTPFVDDCLSRTLPVHVLDITKLRSPRTLARLAGLMRLVMRLEARVAHTYLNDASIVAPLFCQAAGARVVVSRRDMGFWYTPAILRTLRWTNRFVDVIVANSEAVRQNVHARERFPLDRIDLVPNGHDPERFDQAAEPRFREQLGIGATSFLVGMVANLYTRKRQADLLHALTLVRQRHPDTHVVLAGSGPDAENLKHLVASLGLAERVHFIMDAQEVVPIVKHFDVAVLCSESEGSSNALLEYAFCRRPIVCTNVGGNTEVIRNMDTGILVTPGDVAGLGAAIVDLLDSPERARRLGAAARHVAEGRHTRGAMLAAHMALYDRLCGRSRRMTAVSPESDQQVCTC